MNSFNQGIYYYLPKGFIHFRGMLLFRESGY